MCIVIHHPEGILDVAVFGPFPNEQLAMQWATAEFGISGPWYWLPLTPPGSRSA